jgi:hypothetical protein
MDYGIRLEIWIRAGYFWGSVGSFIIFEDGSGYYFAYPGIFSVQDDTIKKNQRYLGSNSV